MHEVETERKFCGACGKVISPSAPAGVCPSCALLTALKPTESELPDLPAPEFANYEILEVIGHGGMGIVYKARQRNTERIVALKVILTGALAGETEVRRFRAEARAVAKLRHPNIVTLFEVGHENGQHFYSMEYVEGESLLEKVRRNRLSAEEAARIVQKVCEAVETAHQEGILHRDLKPANILIDKRGEPRITDFGLAQQRELRTDLTRTGMVLGTPSYMPPEQATGKTREIGVCSDVYSLGATFYETLTGRPPFQAESAIETLRQVVEIPPAAPRLLNPKLARDLEVICLKALRKQPLQRYASALEFGEDIGRFLRKEPIRARPIGIVERNVAWCLRNPALAGAVGAAVLLLGLLAVAALLFRVNLKQNNKVIAERSARLLQDYLREVSEPVVAISEDERFAGWLKPPVETNAIAVFLREKAKELSAKPGLNGVFENWAILDATGDMVIRVVSGTPREGKASGLEGTATSTTLTNRSPRDYFRGAIEKFQVGESQVHFSQVYRSADDDFSKIAVSCAIADPENPSAPIGVISMMIKTFSTEDKRLGLGDEKVKTAILARWDQSATNKAGQTPKWVVWLHPGFKPGADVIPVTEDFDVEGRENLLFYFDPARKALRGFWGPWLTGFKEAPNTPFLVVVQSRDWVLLFLGAAVACVGGCGLALAVYKRRRLRFASRSERA